MKFILKLSIIFIFSFTTLYLSADFQVRSSVNKDADAAVAYNSVNDEYLVVWTEWATSSISVMGQRVKGDGTSIIGAPFTIFSIGVYASVAYNSQTNEYMVTASLFGVIVAQRVSNTGVIQGSPVTLMSKSTSIWSKILYNPLGNNYLVVGASLIDLGNDQSSIKIYTIKVTANGQPVGTDQLIRDQGHGNYSDGAIFSVAYAPVISTETPTGRYLLAIQTPADLTMLDDNGLIVSKVNDSQHPGNIVDNHVPFQQSKVGIAYNVDVAFGNFEGEDVFMVVWGDRDKQANGLEWTGIWAGIVNATTIEFYSHDGVSNTVFPVSSIWAHWATTITTKSWKPVVAFNKFAGKFMVAWRETPSTDPNNLVTVNHIRANAVASSVIPPPANVVLSAVTGNEDPMIPAIATSTKTSDALVVWDDYRNLAAKDVDIYGTLFHTPALLVNISTFLEGPFNSSNSNMDASITTLIPLASPYTADPQNVTIMPSNVVDWVLVELRDKNNSSTVLSSRSALLLKNGAIVDIDGFSPLHFPVSSDYYFIAVKHRNHLSIMSATAVQIAGT